MRVTDKGADFLYPVLLSVHHVLFWIIIIILNAWLNGKAT